MNNLKYTIVLDTKSGFLPKMRVFKKDMDDLGSSVRSAGRQVSKFSEACSGIDFVKFSSMAKVFENVSDSLKTLTSPGVDFEQGMADLQAITGIVGEDFEKIKRAARDVGKESGLGARGAVEAYTLLASQIEISTIGLDGLMELQRETITLAQAGGLSLADAATALAATINQFGLEATEANRVVNVLAAGSKLGASEVEDLAQSFKVVGATASAAGLNVEQTAAALEVLSQSNLKGAEAGTALRNILLTLQTSMKEDFSKSSLSEALERLKPQLNDVTFLAKTFGKANIAAAQYLIKNAESVGELTAAVTGTNTAQEQAAIRTSTMAEQMKRIQANIDDVKISLFEATKGISGYVSALGDTAVMVSQCIPLMQLLGSKALSLGSVIGGCFASGALKVYRFVKSLNQLQVTLGVVAIAQRALNLVMSLNPIGIVIKAVALLVTGLVVAYHKSEWFRGVVDGWVESFKSLFKWVGEAWNRVKKFFGVKDSVTIDGSGTEAEAARARTLREIAELEQRIAVLKERQQYAIGEELKYVTSQIKASEAALAAARERLALSKGVVGGVTGTEGQVSSLSTMAGLEEKIKQLKEQQRISEVGSAALLQREIDLYTQKLNLLQREIAMRAAGNLTDSNYKESLRVPSLVGVDAPSANISIPIQFDVATLKRSWKICQQLFSDSIKEVEVTGEQIQGILVNSLTSFFESLGEAVASGNGLEILKSVLNSVMTLLQAFGGALIAAGVASEAFKNVVGSGWGAIAAGAALIAAVGVARGIISGVSKFASGGIVSGPTLALVGEYGGARSNPEVIAPLSKLKDLIEPAATSAEGLYLETKLRGEDLYIAVRSIEHKKRRVR